MLNDKRGISAIITTVILVGLVLVIVGIVWTVVTNIVGEQTEGTQLAQTCLGINFEITDISCSASAETCNVDIKRATASKSDPIDGVQLTVTDKNDPVRTVTLDTASDIAVSTTIALTETNPTNGVGEGDGIRTGQAEASLRIYFEDEAGDPQYCSQVASYSA